MEKVGIVVGFCRKVRDSEDSRRRRKVAIVQLTKPLFQYDLVHIGKRKNGKTDIYQVVESMEINHVQVSHAPAEAVIGLLVDRRVRLNDVVARINENPQNMWNKLIADARERRDKKSLARLEMLRLIYTNKELVPAFDVCECCT